MKGILGIVNFEESRVKIEGLSEYRTIPAMSMLGRYRIVDFILSNMVNSEIETIKLLTKEKPRSLVEYLGTGSQYDLNSKTGSLQILYTNKDIGNDLYYTDVAILHQYRQQIEECKEDYIVIGPSYMICTLDYRQLVKFHEQTGAEITCVYKEVDDANKNFIGCDEFEFVGETNRIERIKMSHGSTLDKYISLETYVIKKDRFLRMIDNAHSLSAIYSLRDYLMANTKYFNMVGYQYTGYLKCINSIRQYYYTNLELIDHIKAKQLFNKLWPIYTKTQDNAPAFYSANAKVKNSLVANGSVIQGTVENCIIGRGVKIKRGAVVKNSIILPHSVIGSNAKVEYAIVDKGAKVLTVKNVIGNEDNLLYVRRRDVVQYERNFICSFRGLAIC